MNANGVIGVIRTAVQNVKKHDQSVVSVDALLDFLGGLEENVENDQRADIADFQAKHESTLAYYNAQQTISLEVLRSVYSYGQSALKRAILINGGSAVACWHS